MNFGKNLFVQIYVILLPTKKNSIFRISIMLLNRQKMVNCSLGLCVFFFTHTLCQINLIRYGDFEGYPLNIPYIDFFYRSIKYDNILVAPSSYWYALQQSNSYKYFFQVKQHFVNGFRTKVLDFISTNSYKICQNVSLQIGQQYQLKYNFIIDAPHINSTLFCSLNDLPIHSVISASYIVPTLGVYNFTASNIQNSFCFRSVSLFKNPNNYLQISQYGPLLDNVSLIVISPGANASSSLNLSDPNNTTVITNNQSLIPIPNPVPTNSTTTLNKTMAPSAQTIYIDIYTFWNSESGILYLSSNFYIRKYGLTLDLISFFVVTMAGNMITHVDYSLDIQGCLAITAYPESVVTPDNLANLKVYLPPDFYQFVITNCHFVFTINGNQVTQDMFTNDEWLFIKTIEPVTEKIASIIRQAFIFTDIFYSSYFLFNLIEFWNLALMYNFLPLNSVPKFVYSLFTKMINYFFTSNSISQSIRKIAHQDQFLLQSFLRELNKQEKITVIRNNRIWFGFVGFSSNFLINNLDTLMLLILFIMKYTIAYFLNKLLPAEFKAKRQKGRFFHLLSKEIICFLPGIIVSSLSLKLFLAETRTLGKINTFLHTFLLSFIIFILVCSITSRNPPKINKNNIKSQYHITDNIHKSKIHMLGEILQILLSILIPCLVVIGSKISFFIIISFVLSCKLFAFALHFKNIKIFGRILGMLQNIVWITFHLTYIIFYILDILSSKGIIISEIFTKYLGFVAISCVLIGGLLNIVQCIARTIFAFYQIIISFRKYFSRVNNSLKQNEKKQVKQNIFLQTIQIQSKQQQKKNKKQLKLSPFSNNYSLGESKIFIHAEKLSQNRVKITGYKPKKQKRTNF